MPRASRALTGGLQLSSSTLEQDEEGEGESEEEDEEDEEDEEGEVGGEVENMEEEENAEEDNQEYEGYVVGARLVDGTLEYLVYWDGYGEHRCSFQPATGWICDATDMELTVRKDFMLVYKGGLRKCKFVRCVDKKQVELRWCRVPTPSLPPQFILHLDELCEDIAEWSLYGYDEE